MEKQNLQADIIQEEHKKRLTERGREGERIVREHLQKIFPNAGIYSNKILLKSGNHDHEADIIVVDARGIFVFEIKNWEGIILGQPFDKKWTQKFSDDTTELRPNPLLQNNVHRSLLEKLINDSKKWRCYNPFDIVPILVFIEEEGNKKLFIKHWEEKTYLYENNEWIQDYYCNPIILTSKDLEKYFSKNLKSNKIESSNLNMLKKIIDELPELPEYEDEDDTISENTKVSQKEKVKNEPTLDRKMRDYFYSYNDDQYKSIETALLNNMWFVADILKNGLSNTTLEYSAEALTEYVKKTYIEITKSTEKDVPILEEQIRKHFSAYNDKQYETIKIALLNNLWFTVKILDDGLRHMTAWYTVDSLTEYIKKMYIEIFNYAEKKKVTNGKEEKQKKEATLEEQMRDHFSLLTDAQYKPLEAALLNNMWFTAEIIEEKISSKNSAYTIGICAEDVVKRMQTSYAGNFKANNEKAELSLDMWLKEYFPSFSYSQHQVIEAALLKNMFFVADIFKKKFSNKTTMYNIEFYTTDIINKMQEAYIERTQQKPAAVCTEEKQIKTQQKRMHNKTYRRQLRLTFFLIIALIIFMYWEIKRRIGL